MLNNVARVFIALSLFIGVAHADKYDDAMTQYVKTLGEFETQMSQIKDQQTAETAEPQLTETVKQFASLKQRLVDVGRPSEERREELRKTYGPKVEASMKSLFAEMGRVAKIKEVRPVMERVMVHMNKAP